jgi:hypothetical protein
VSSSCSDPLRAPHTACGGLLLTGVASVEYWRKRRSHAANKGKTVLLYVFVPSPLDEVVEEQVVVVVVPSMVHEEET